MIKINSVKPNVNLWNSDDLRNLLKRKLMVGIIGGWNQETDTIFDDTWIYDYKTNVWNEIDTNSPGVRSHHTIAFASDANQIVLFAGYEIPYGPLVDPTTWIYTLGSSIPIKNDESDNGGFLDFEPLSLLAILIMVPILKRNKPFRYRTDVISEMAWLLTSWQL